MIPINRIEIEVNDKQSHGIHYIFRRDLITINIKALCLSNVIFNIVLFIILKFNYKFCNKIICSYKCTIYI